MIIVVSARGAMLPTDLLNAFFWLFVVAPAVAAFLAFKGSPLVRQLSRFVLLSAWLAHAAATLACLRYAFAKPDSGIGNQVLLLVAIPFTGFAILWFGVWRAARRHAYVQSLPPAERRIEELVDIDRGLEGARKNLAAAERRLKSWWISTDERERLQSDIGLLSVTIARLEQERLKRA